MYSLLRMKAFILVQFFACVLFFAGCSIRHIPLDQSVVEQDPVMGYVAGSYYSGNGISSPTFAADAWRMSQYYRGGISSSQSSSVLGPQASGRLNVDPNPYDSYRSSEVPVMRAPTQHATSPEQKIVETRRRTRSPQSSDWRRKRVVDQAGSNGRQVRRSLEERRHAEDIDEDDGSNKEKSRQKNRKRTRRRK